MAIWPKVMPRRLDPENPSAGEDAFDNWNEWEEFVLSNSIEVSSNVGNFESYFHGVKVNFPYDPYQSQNQMMDNIVTGVQTRTNCLLESPTGTGKTAALLCSLLAWQKEHQFLQKSFFPTCDCGFDIPGSVITQSEDPETQEVKLHRAALVGSSPTSNKSSQVHSSARSNATPTCSKKMRIEMPAVTKTLSEVCEACLEKHVTKGAPSTMPEEQVPVPVPTIYYTTRTHSQISQVVKQLKETAYAGTPMTILSSRNLTCINKVVRDNAHAVPIDDECQIRRQNFHKNKNRRESGDVVEEATPVCEFFNRREILESEFSSEFGAKTFDIEDLIEFGDQEKLCPYYGARALQPTARIVFCPYNYVLYPWIRKACKIEIENNIIVFDEAHNIEGICRDVASIEIKEDFLQSRIIMEIEYMWEKLRTAVNIEDRSMNGRLEKLMQKYSVIFQRLMHWIKNQGKRISIQQNQVEVYSQLELDDVVRNVGEFGFSKTSMSEHAENLEFMRDKETTPKIPDQIISFINRLRYTMSLLYKQEGLETQDFSAILTKRVGGAAGKEFTCTLKLLCNNPALAFRKFREARTIIVASGTLSPTVSFASELGVPFPHVLTARHVIKREQIWAGCLSNSGNPYIPLDLIKHHQSEPGVQDFLGEQILRICQIVPCGVVVFLPSYTLRDALTHRWSSYPPSSPLLPRLSELKTIYYEASGQDREEFKEQMADYKRKVTDGRGCVLFAIFRGKVSEGVDFKDDEARCVVSVGIPHLPVGSPEVVVKKAYNKNRNKADPTYLSGDSWYACQAFRALNQGLGRCIRHKDDWGALVLLDSRFSESRNSSKLSVWVAEFFKSYETPREFEMSLIDFINRNRKSQDRN